MSEYTGLKPLYIQAADRICQEILKNNFREGERLPRMNQLSRMFHLNSSAMERGLELLADQNILKKELPLGYKVEKDAHKLLQERQQKMFFEHKLPEFLAQAKNIGIDRQMIIEYLEKEA